MVRPILDVEHIAYGLKRMLQRIGDRQAGCLRVRQRRKRRQCRIADRVDRARLRYGRVGRGRQREADGNGVAHRFGEVTDEADCTLGELDYRLFSSSAVGFTGQAIVAGERAEPHQPFVALLVGEAEVVARDERLVPCCDRCRRIRCRPVEFGIALA